MWLLKLALAILACPHTFLPLACRTLAAAQLRRTVIELPHRRRELHVAFELGAGSTALAVAIMAQCGALVQWPLLGIKVAPSPCLLARAAALWHTILASAECICVHPLVFGILCPALLCLTSTALPGSHAFIANSLYLSVCPPRRWEILLGLHCSTSKACSLTFRRAPRALEPRRVLGRSKAHVFFAEPTSATLTSNRFSLLSQPLHASFAMRILFVQPLLLRKLRLRLHRQARAFAKPLWYVLLLNGLPINLLAAHLPQKQTRSFWLALREDIPIKRAEDQQVLLLPGACRSHVAGDTTDASTDL